MINIINSFFQGIFDLLHVDFIVIPFLSLVTVAVVMVTINIVKGRG